MINDKDIMNRTFSTSIAVELVHIPTGISVVCDKFKSLNLNKKLALIMLETKLAEY